MEKGSGMRKDHITIYDLNSIDNGEYSNYAFSAMGLIAMSFIIGEDQ